MKFAELYYDEHITRQEYDVLYYLYLHSFVNQRILSENTGYSLGMVNQTIKKMIKIGFLDNENQMTEKAKDFFQSRKPKNAIILAAGFGMRMVPINTTCPKALLEVDGECLIERTIKQLHEVGIFDITVVVGFMKDSFEYLIDQYGVELLYNPDYATSNNIKSLNIALDRLSNTYIIPSDIWCAQNPYRSTEPYSWYMVNDLIDKESTVRANRKMELVTVPDKEPGNGMIGICYLLEEESNQVRDNVSKLIEEGTHNNSFWEISLYDKDRMFVWARVEHSTNIVEINTYEQLRELDYKSDQLNSDAIDTICDVLECDINEIKKITVLKKGMTNRSFLFTVSNKKYIMRIPGEGTDKLINRKHEANVYKAISGLGLCDDPIYINPENGYKITEFLEGVRVCDCKNIEDLNKCMNKLKQFHDMKLSIHHSFDIIGQINFYEKLWCGEPSIYKDYKKTKENVLSLSAFIDSLNIERCLTHIDAVPDNFLFYTPDDAENERLQLTDWEYAGMQDPHVDIAMFCIYSLYSKTECDRLIDIYFNNECSIENRTKIYCYISMCGLLWSNWCEYKRKLGVEFGEYSLRQYRFAKEYYKYAKEMMEYNQE